MKFAGEKLSESIKNNYIKRVNGTSLSVYSNPLDEKYDNGECKYEFGKDWVADMGYTQHYYVDYTPVADSKRMVTKPYVLHRNRYTYWSDDKKKDHSLGNVYGICKRKVE